MGAVCNSAVALVVRFFYWIMQYLLLWAVFLVLFYLLVGWRIRRTPLTEDDGKEVGRLSRLLEQVAEKWESR